MVVQGEVDGQALGGIVEGAGVKSRISFSPFSASKNSLIWSSTPALLKSDRSGAVKTNGASLATDP
jgi:hypothetical protein